MKAESFVCLAVCPLGSAFHTHLPGVWGGPDLLEAGRAPRSEVCISILAPKGPVCLSRCPGSVLAARGRSPGPQQPPSHSVPPPALPRCLSPRPPRLLTPWMELAVSLALSLAWSLTGVRGTRQAFLLCEHRLRPGGSPSPRPAAPQAPTCRLPADAALSGHLNAKALESTPGFAFQTRLRAGPSRGPALPFGASQEGHLHADDSECPPLGWLTLPLHATCSSAGTATARLSPCASPWFLRGGTCLQGSLARGGRVLGAILEAKLGGQS